MQKLESIKKSGATLETNKTNKKNKATGNSKNTAKINLQFSEILGQLSIAPPPAQTAIAKQTEAAQPEKVVNPVKSAKVRAEGVRNTGQSTEAAKGKAEVGVTANLPNKPVKMLAKTNSSASTGEVTVQPSDTTRVNKSKSEIESNASITENKVSGMEKPVGASTIEKLLGTVTPANTGNSSDSESQATADIMGSQVSSMAKSMARTLGEKHSTSTSSTNKATAQSEIKIADTGKPKDQSEIKIADLMLANHISPAENTASTSTGKKLSPKQEASAGSINSARTSHEIVVNGKENTENRDKEVRSESPGARTQPTKTETANNVQVIGEHGAGEFKAAEISGANVEPTMLSKEQTDFLVSKMIQQIKVAPSSLEVTLKPEYLGKINILVQSIAGVISVNVIAQNSEALNLVNSNLQSIKDNLQQQGVNVQQLDVNLANQERQGNRNSHGFSGQSQTAQLVEKANTLIEYNSLANSERSSLLSRGLNLLA